MRRRSLFMHIVIGLVLLICSCLEAAADITVEASLSHLAFPVDQGAMLSITVNGSGRISAVELPKIEGIHFSSRGQSSRINMINGSVTSSLTNNYLVQADKPGIYTIPPIKVTAGGDSAATKSMSFEVTASGRTGTKPGSPDRPDADADVAFIRVSGIGSHYPGEIVPVTIKAYFRQEYRTDIHSLVTLQGDGVVMPPLREKPRQTEEIISGEAYSVLSWETTLSGIKEGSHPLTFSLEASLLIPQKRQSRSPFGGGRLFDDSVFNDPFFDSFLGGYQRKPITVNSPQIVFRVVPLPTDNQPANFSGAIGDFNLQVTANHQEIEIGEPLTLTMAITGRGNFDRVDAPLFPESSDWKTYSPTSTFADHGRSGSKSFEQAIVARNSAITEIPSLSFSYFDPSKKNYITRTSSPIPVSIKAGGAPPVTAAKPAKISAETQQPQAAADQTVTGMAGLAPIHLEAGRFHARLVPLWQKAWFLGVCTFCLLTLIVLLLHNIRQQQRAKHPEREHRRRIKLRLSEELEKIDRARSAGDGFAFLALCRTAIQNQLGLRWNMTPTAISLADLKSRLQADSGLIEIFRAADEAAYGGAVPSGGKMMEYQEKLTKELEALL